jgi:cytochrome c oxidase subunit 5b
MSVKMNSKLLVLGSKFLLKNPGRMIATSTVKLTTSKDETFPDPLELATGMEKKEMLMRLAGNDDPFTIKSLKFVKNSKDKPIEIPSAFEARIIGCDCDEDASHVKWMWVHEGEKKRCSCGHWFTLVYKEPFMG